MKNKIESIIVHIENSLYHDADVKYEGIDDIENVEGFSRVVDVLSEFSMQERMLLDDLLKNKKVIMNEIIKKKINKKSICALSLFVASVLAISQSAYVLSKNKYTRDDKNVKGITSVVNTPMPTLKPTISVTSKTTANPTLKPTELVTVAPTITPNPYSSITKVEVEGSKENKFTQNLDKEYVELDDLCVRVRAFNSGEDKSKLAFNRIISDISNKCYSNIEDLRNLVSFGKMTGNKYLLTFQHSFDEGTVDFFILDKFCNERNDIVTNAYKKDQTKEIVKFLKELNDFIMNNKPIYNGQRWIYYPQLNNFSKLFLEDLYLFMLIPNVNYTPIINGSKWNKNQLMEELQEYINDTCQSIELSISKVKKY